MSRITLEEFVEENELNELLPENKIEIEDSDTADLVAEQATEGVEEALEQLQDYGIAIEQFADIVIAHEAICAKQTISTEDFVAYKTKLSVAIENMGGTSQRYFPALENATDYRIALEESEERIKSLGEKFVTGMSKIMAGLRDNLYYLVQFCDFQSKRVADVKQQLQNSSGDKVTLTFPRIMYFCYDDGKEVTSAKEYLAKLKESVKVLNVLTSETSEFTRKDLFSGLRNFVFMFGKDNFIRNYNSYTQLLNNVRSSTKFTSSREYKVSPYLLGEYKISLMTPNVDIQKVDYGDYRKLKSLKEQTQNMGMVVSHNIMSRSGTIELKDIDKKIAEDILKEIETLIDGYQTFYKLFTKLSHYGAIKTVGGLLTGAISRNLGTLSWTTLMIIFIINYRLTYQMSGTILTTSGTVLNIAKGTTKTALTVVERYINNTKK